jgi:glutamyl-Q tRNA(Asp) synthetase
VDRSGQKLSKQTGATAVDGGSPTDNLWLILSLLGHEPPDALSAAEPTELLAWVTAQWDLAQIPPSATLTRFVCI